MYRTVPLPDGEILQGRYRIMRSVGQGGMGRVYKACDIRDQNKIVAIKEMLQGSLGEKELQRAQVRFEQEADFLRKLTRRPHAHIPTFYSNFSDQDGPGGQKRFYLVMDFIEGKTLHQLLQEAPGGHLSVEQVLKYGSQLCEVLADLHQQSPPVIFRDLKPSNVIITPADVVYLIDFGVARHFKAEQTSDTELFRSQGYSPPELGLEQTGPRSDLYCLGATLHHCLTGHHPKDNEPRVYNFLPPSSYNLLLPVRFDNLILKLVATSPAKRPQNVREVEVELELVKQFLASPTEVMREAAESYQAQTYYDSRLAEEAQLRVEWSQVNRLPGRAGLLWRKALPFFAIVGSWCLYLWRDKFLPFCRQLGIWAFSLTQKIRERTQQREQKRLPDKRKQPPKPDPFDDPPFQRPDFLPPRPPRSYSRTASTDLPLPAVQVEEEVRPEKQSGSGLLPGQRFSSWSTWLGFLLFTVVGSLGIVLAQHRSPLALVFGLGLCLQPGVIIIGDRRADRSLEAILTALLLAGLLISISAFSQPGVETLLGAITVEQLLVGGLAALGVVALFRSLSAGSSWPVHLVIALLALSGVFIQYNLGMREMSGLPVSFSEMGRNIFNVLCLVALSLAAIIPLFNLRQPFSNWTCLALLLAAVCCALQFSVFGAPALHFLTDKPLPQFRGFVGVVCIMLPVLAFLSFYLQQRVWGMVVRLALLLLLGLSLILLLFAQAKGGAPLFGVRPFDLSDFKSFLVSALVALAVLVSYLFWARSRLLFADTLVMFLLTMAGLLLTQLMPVKVFPTGLSQVIGEIVSGAGWLVLGLISVSLLTVALQLFLPERKIEDVVLGLNWLAVLLKYILLLFIALVCLAYQWLMTQNSSAGSEGELSTQFMTSPSLTYTQLLLAPLALAAFIALIQTVRTLHNILRNLGQPRWRRLNAKLDEDTDGLLFGRWDRTAQFILICFLGLFVLFQEQLSAPDQPIGGIIPLPPFSSWIMVVGLLLAVVAMFFWRRYSPDKNERLLLSVFTWSLAACTVIAAASLLFLSWHAATGPILLLALLGLFHGLLLLNNSQIYTNRHA